MQNYPFNYKNYGKKTLNIFTTVLLCLIVGFAVFRIAFGLTYFRVYVVGASMEGTLNGAVAENAEGGDYVYAFRTSTPHRGDIIVIDTADKPIIKRVIALGGDKVELKEGVLYVNGIIVEEPYVSGDNNTPSEPRNTFPETEIPEGHMFFMGDNRDVSIDSRSEKYGTLPVDNMMGVVANWSMSFKSAVTAFNTFFDFKVAKAFTN